MKLIRLLATAMAGAATLVLLRRRPGRLRLDRGRAALRLAARGGARYAASAPRLFATAGEQRQLLREDLALQTAEDVASTLGAMKGVMMKIGQMASYIDGGLSPAVRGTLARLQDSVPPMSPALAAAVVEEELGAPPERAFARWDPRPIPAIIDELSTRRLVTSELSGGARFAELATWPQHERDLAAETIYRFVFRSLYDVRTFNGDPHPGNYLFHRGGKVTFLDFGLVRHFTPAELQPLMRMARTICVEHDPEAFRRNLENAGFLRPGAPLSTQAIVEHLAVFYDTIREPGPLTITSDYASSVVRRFFDLRSPFADYISVPRPYVLLQRINLGLFAVLGELSATADWRAISEEIWPFVHGPAATPMGEAEAAWRARP